MSPAQELCVGGPLAKERVLEKGREWLLELFGPSFPGPVDLAGGAYKTLIHGRPPRDIDLWAPTKSDQERIIEVLLARGARLRGDNPPYQRVFERQSLVVEVAYSTSAVSLEGRLDHFDIGLSAIGVSWNHGEFRALVHPLAQRSVCEQRIYLHYPLVNWKYALWTLERAQRYASELSYTLPRVEEDTIWSLFRAQSKSDRQKMLDRYVRVSTGDPEILARAERLMS